MQNSLVCAITLCAIKDSDHCALITLNCDSNNFNDIELTNAYLGCGRNDASCESTMIDSTTIMTATSALIAKHFDPQVGLISLANINESQLYDSVYCDLSHALA